MRPLTSIAKRVCGSFEIVVPMKCLASSIPYGCGNASLRPSQTRRSFASATSDSASAAFHGLTAIAPALSSIPPVPQPPSAHNTEFSCKRRSMKMRARMYAHGSAACQLVVGQRPLLPASRRGHLAMTHDVEDHAIRICNEEATYTPRFIGQRIDDFQATLKRPLVDRVNVRDFHSHVRMRL